MRVGELSSVAGLAMLGVVIAGCHQAPPASPAPAPAVASEHYCWWAVYRTALPVDSVAGRFQKVYASLGLTTFGPFTLGDTAWVRAGPASSAAPAPGSAAVLSGARMVAYRVGDSTHFRTYVSMRDSSGGTIIPRCQQIARAAAVATIAPREPDGEEKLAVWRPR